VTFYVNIIKEKSYDPDFKINVSLYKDGICMKNFQVDLLRQPPKISFRYHDEIKETLSKMDQQKLELEILNKVAEYIMEHSSTCMN